ncbi:MAG: hypothetical protein ACOCQ4_02375 [bacterium]
MEHRHIEGDEWSMVAVHSVFERGSDQDILELKELVRQDYELAMMVYKCCDHSDVYAIPELFKAIIERLYGRDNQPLLSNL